MAISATNSSTIHATFDKLRYGVTLQSRIDPTGKLRVSATLNLQRAAKDSDAGTWIDDPSPRARRVENIADLEAFAAANPDLAPLIAEAWARLDALVGAINAKRNLL